MNDANQTGTPATAILFPPTSDDGATGATAPSSELAARIEAASDRATASLPDSGKRKPGQRGPDKSKRRAKGVSVADVAGSSAESLLAESESPANSFDWQSDDLGLDVETAKALADVGVEIFKEGRAGFTEFMALRITGDAEVAKSTPRPMPEKLEVALTKASTAIAIKYGQRIQYAPELTALFIVLAAMLGDAGRLVILKKQMRQINASASNVQPMPS